MNRQKIRRALIISLVILLLLLLAIWILPVSLPILLAFFTALVLGPIVNLLQLKLKLRRQYAVLIIFLVFLCVIGFGGYFLTSKIVSEGIQLVESLPQYVNDAKQMWDNTEENIAAGLDAFPPEFVNELNRQIDTFFENTRYRLAQLDYFGYITKFITEIPNFLVSFLVYLIALFLFMLEMPRLKTKLYSHLTEKTSKRVSFMTSRLSHVFIGFFKGQVLVSIIIFFVSLIGLYLIAPDVALVMSFIIWIIDVIPIIGSIVILGPWSVYKFIVGDPVMGTKLAILAVILLAIRRTVEPKVMGKQIGLSPLPTLISMYIGLKLFGFIGFFVGPLIVIFFNSAREAGIIKLNFKI
ncbi:sporulation integral membrane protein YtvI [Pueribacillus theae]|uniref:Sporulation integral membrane protein YtvI n=1 Tax=Pueribacillus theae TaxID=2171751 RepID=A0A2U1K8B0_9BACI|nr:sporulation integral membrane protein YtvI [Pueribacillus theae]PWA13383.1 sporulation integral membrane protein YtvI [Pueribacillus theae]